MVSIAELVESRDTSSGTTEIGKAGTISPPPPNHDHPSLELWWLRSIRHLRRLISSHRPTALFLSEVKISSKVVIKKTSSSFAFNSFEFVPPEVTLVALF